MTVVFSRVFSEYLVMRDIWIDAHGNLQKNVVHRVEAENFLKCDIVKRVTTITKIKHDNDRTNSCDN